MVLLPIISWSAIRAAALAIHTAIVILSWNDWWRLIHALLLWLCSLNVNLAAQNVRVLHVLDKILGYGLVFECNKSKTTRLLRVDVLENDCTLNWSKLLKVLSQVVIVQFEIKAANEYL